MKNLKVSLIEPVGGHGGMDYYDYGLAYGLGYHNVEVLFYTAEKTQVRLYKNVKTIPAFGKLWSKSVIAQVIIYLKGHYRAYAEAKSNGIEIVHLHFFVLRSIDLVVLWMAKKMKLKTVATMHDVNSFHLKASSGVEDRCYKLIDGIIVHNQSSLVALKSKPTQSKVAVIPHGNYLPFIKEVQVKPKNEVFTLLFFGQIKEIKGLDILLNAVAAIKQKQISIKLIIAGKAWKNDLTKYHNLINELGLNEVVETHFRYIPDAEVADYYAQADLVVLPYREIYQSGVLLLTMSYSKPVLCSNLEAFQEIITDGVNGFVFKNGDSDSLAGKITSIMKMQDLGPVLQNANKLIRDKYSWENIGEKTKVFYEQVLS